MKTTVKMDKNPYIIANTIMNLLTDYNVKNRNDLHYIRLEINKSIVIIIKMLRCIDSDSSVLLYVYSVELQTGECTSLLSTVLPYGRQNMIHSAIETVSSAIADITIAYVAVGDCEITSYMGSTKGSVLDIFTKHSIEYTKKQSFSDILDADVSKYIKRLDSTDNMIIINFSFAINQNDPEYNAKGIYRTVITYAGCTHDGQSAYSVKLVIYQPEPDCYYFVTYDELRDILLEAYSRLFGAVNGMLIGNEKSHLVVYTLRPECLVMK